MCQNIQNMKIPPATAMCDRGDFVKKRVLAHPPLFPDFVNAPPKSFRFIGEVK